MELIFILIAIFVFLIVIANAPRGGSATVSPKCGPPTGNPPKGGSSVSYPGYPSKSELDQVYRNIETLKEEKLNFHLNVCRKAISKGLRKGQKQFTISHIIDDQGEWERKRIADTILTELRMNGIHGIEIDYKYKFCGYWD